MIRRFIVASGALLLSGCAFHTQVQRFGVEYNEALASMANEQALLNILRSSRGMPTHFTSVSRFTGTLSLKASGSVNGQLRGSGLMRTATNGGSLSTATTAGTSVAPTGTTTSGSVVTTPGSSNSIVEAVAEGVDLYTPQVGGELNSGTAFDVQVFDQQKFYQGILSGVRFSTVEMLINQGFEPDLIANLLIARVDFYEKDLKTKGKMGDAVASYRNDASDRARFQNLVDCNVLDVAESRSQETRIAPVSRLELGKDAAKGKLSLGDLALFDGGSFGLSGGEGISADGSTDTTVFVVKPGTSSRIPRLIGRSCPTPAKPEKVPPEGVYLNDGTAFVAGKKDSHGVVEVAPTEVIMEITFRSPEAVIRAVGDIVRLQPATFPASGPASIPRLAICVDGTTTCAAEDKHYKPLFQLSARRDRTALLGARFMNVDYSVPASDFRSMQVISIIEQLINLQKESSENALSIPVRAVP